jgi:hypothetical protein
MQISGNIILKQELFWHWFHQSTLYFLVMMDNDPKHTSRYAQADKHGWQKTESTDGELHNSGTS